MRNYQCPECNKMIPVDRSAIKAGDTVSFCKINQTSRSARFSSKEGKVINRVGDQVTVQYRKEIIKFDIDAVTPADAPNPLTYAFSGTCECGTKPTDFMWLKILAGNDLEKAAIVELLKQVGCNALVETSLETPCLIVTDAHGKTYEEYASTSENSANTTILELRDLVLATQAVPS